MRSLGASAATVLLFLTVVCPAGASEPLDPSPANNVMFLRYDVETKKPWMNFDTADKHAESMTVGTGFFNKMSILFPIEPRLNRSNFLLLNATRDWVVNLHIDMKTRQGTYDCHISDVVASLTVGNATLSHKEPQLARGYHSFNMSVGLAILDPAWNLLFNFSYTGGSDLSPMSVTIYTEGSSNVVLPVSDTDIDTDFDGTVDSLDPDDDNDGHNDTVDAYPLDLTRWMKPTAHPTPLWLYASPLPAILAIIVGAVLWRRRRRLRSAEPPQK